MRRHNPDLAANGQVALSDEIIADETTTFPLAEGTTAAPLSDAAQAAKFLLWETSILDVMRHDLAMCGLVGEEEAATLLYLVNQSAKGPKPLHAVIHGDSSSGKSNLVKSVLKFVPEASQKVVSSMSDHALEYSADDAAHQVLFIEELPGTRNVEYALRILQSEGALRRLTTDITATESKTKEQVVRHPVATITTTTRPGIHYENATRVFQIRTDGSEDQTRAVIDSLAAREAGLSRTASGSEECMAKWHELYRFLPHQSVVIPFATILPQAFGAESPRARRDFSKFVGLIKESAILHQFTRPWIREEEETFILANTRDLSTAQQIWVALQAQDCPHTRPWHAILEPLRQAGVQGLTALELCRALGKKEGNSSVQRYHKAALEAGCIQVMEGPKPRYRWIRDPEGELGSVTTEAAEAATRDWESVRLAQVQPTASGLP